MNKTPNQSTASDSDLSMLAGSEISEDDWLTAFQEYEDACGDGFGENRIMMMQAFCYGWDMRTHKHSFQNGELNHE